MTLDSPLVAALVETAVAAGRAILEVAAGGIVVATKADASPVTLADARAEAIVLAALARLAPAVPVVAEESVAHGIAPRALGDRFFLVDPLDGTREFVSGNGEYTVNIALVEAGRPVLGVIHAPVSGEVHVGVVGDGARAGHLAPDGSIAWTPIRVRTVPADGPTVAVSRSHAGPETAALIARLGIARRVAAGSSLKFCRLAEGRADLYPRLGRTMEWDTAAGEAVLVAAGGWITDTGGRPLVYGKRGRPGSADFANPWFLAGGDSALGAPSVAAMTAIGEGSAK